MSALWTSPEIAAAVGGKSSGSFACDGIAIDSRAVVGNDLFIALVGPTNDGHAYVRDALASGATGALVHAVPEGVDPAKLVVVRDTFLALQALGHAGRERLQGRVVGVTGSVGKTSTKEMLAVALAPFGATHAAVGSFNNHWGVPLTLARAPRTTDYAVIEMGMNHTGELRALTAIARPHGAVVTWIAPAHLEFFGTTAAIAEAKAEIFEGVATGGFAVLPKDCEHFGLLAAKARNFGLEILTFGVDGAADLRLLSHTVEAGRTSVTAMVDGDLLSYSVGAAGRHWAMNSLAVLCVAKALGLDVERAARPLAAMEPPKGRGRRSVIGLETGDFTLVDESYNANPTSVTAALSALGLETPGPRGRRIAVLGDMLELGPDAPTLHVGLAGAVIENRVDAVFAAGPMMAGLYAALPEGLRGARAVDSAALAPLVAEAVRPGDVVMIKGSLGSQMGRIVTALKDLDHPRDGITSARR